MSVLVAVITITIEMWLAMLDTAQYCVLCIIFSVDLHARFFRLSLLLLLLTLGSSRSSTFLYIICLHASLTLVQNSANHVLQKR